MEVALSGPLEIARQEVGDGDQHVTVTLAEVVDVRLTVSSRTGDIQLRVRRPDDSDLTMRVGSPLR